MNKIMKSMVAGSLAAALLSSAAGAANFETAADTLNKLGLFNGTESGYELDRAADRAEAATMLVRLLGKEAEAKAFYESKTNPAAAAAVTTPAEETKPEAEATPAAELTPAEPEAVYAVSAEDMGLKMEGNTLYVADETKLRDYVTKNADVWSDVESEDYAKLAWVAVDVNVPEGATAVKFSYEGMGEEEQTLDLKDASYQMMTAKDGKLSFNTAVAAETKDGKLVVFPAENQVEKHFVWLDKDGKEIGTSDAALIWATEAPKAEETPAEETKPEETKPEETKPEEKADEAYVFPFTDMDNGYEWAKPYVAWLYDQGLTSGATATTFEPNKAVTSQQYATFLMRALGYSDKTDGDFTYDNALDFAKEKGVVDAVNLDDTFDRDNLAALSYTALSVAPKGAETGDLLSKLVADKAIDAEKAAPVQATFDTLREFNQTYAKYATTTAVDSTADFTMNMKLLDESVDANGSFSIQVKADPAKMEDMEMAMKGSIKMTIPGAAAIEMPMEMYVKDGVSYMNVMDQKIKQDLGLENMLKGFDIQSMSGMSNVPLCMLDAISKDGSTYKMSYNVGVFNGLFAEIFSSMTGSIQITDEMKAQGITADMFKMSVDLSKADVEITFKSGNLYSESMDMAMSMEMMGQKIDVTMGMDMEVKGTGDKVKVVYPEDLDSYLTAEEAAKALEDAAKTPEADQKAEPESTTPTDAPAPAAE